MLNLRLDLCFSHLHFVITHRNGNILVFSRFIFVARVLVGFFEKGSPNQRTPGAQATGEQFDSTASDDLNPSIFVLYRDARAYPEFLYVFT